MEWSRYALAETFAGLSAVLSLWAGEKMVKDSRELIFKYARTQGMLRLELSVMTGKPVNRRQTWGQSVPHLKTLSHGPVLSGICGQVNWPRHTSRKSTLGLLNQSWQCSSGRDRLCACLMEPLVGWANGHCSLRV